jgi:hypothetical protein
MNAIDVEKIVKRVEENEQNGRCLRIEDREIPKFEMSNKESEHPVEIPIVLANCDIGEVKIKNIDFLLSLSFRNVTISSGIFIENSGIGMIMLEDSEIGGGMIVKNSEIGKCSKKCVRLPQSVIMQNAYIRELEIYDNSMFGNIGMENVEIENLYIENSTILGNTYYKNVNIKGVYAKNAAFCGNVTYIDSIIEGEIERSYILGKEFVEGEIFV